MKVGWDAEERREEGFAEGMMWVRWGSLVSRGWGGVGWGFFWVSDLGIHGGEGGF